MLEAPIDNEDNPGLINRAIKVLAYPFSAVIGYWVTRSHIRNSTYDNLKEHGGFSDILPSHDEGLRKSIGGAVERVNRGEIVEIVKETAPLQHEYTAAIRNRFRQMGVGDLSKQWGFIHKTQKHQAMLDGLTATGITLGSLLVIANSKAIGKLFQRRDKDESAGKGPSASI